MAIFYWLTPSGSVNGSHVIYYALYIILLSFAQEYIIEYLIFCNFSQSR